MESLEDERENEVVWPRNFVEREQAVIRSIGVHPVAYGELRERTMLGETITEERLTATVERAVTLFLNGYAAGAPRQP